MGTLELCNDALKSKVNNFKVSESSKLKILNRIRALSNKKVRTRNHVEEMKTLETKLVKGADQATVNHSKRPTSKRNMRWLGSIIRVLPQSKSC